MPLVGLLKLIVQVVNIISACCGEFSDDAYPRLETISHLQSIISRYPRLAKDGSAALVDLGAAIQDNAQSGEVKAMIAGTLSQDYNVRSASLQALQVSRALYTRLKCAYGLACRSYRIGLFTGTLDCAT